MSAARSMKSWVSVLKPLSAGVLAAIALSAAHAGLFDDEEARKQILSLRNQLAETQRTLDQRVGELESQARNRSIIDLFNQVETLKTEFARLRGQIELLQNELETTQKRQRDLYVDLDGRMRKIEAQIAEQDRAAAAARAQAPAAVTGASMPPGAPPSVTPTTVTPPAADVARTAPPAPVVVVDPVAE